MQDTDEPCKWTFNINVKTKFDFKKTFSSFLNLTKIQSFIKSHISIKKHIKREISTLKFTTKRQFKY